MSVWTFLTDPMNWTGSDGIGTRLVTHAWVSATAILTAALIALPTGFALGHLRRGRVVAVAIANLTRAVPSLAVLAFVVAAGWGIGFVPTWLAMVALALPPIFVAALVGVAEVDDAVIDAARGMGLRGHQILRHVELPIALPVVVSGLRVAAGQVIATARSACLSAGNTLGVHHGRRANCDDAMLHSGVVIIIVAALIVDVVLRVWRAGFRGVHTLDADHGRFSVLQTLTRTTLAATATPTPQRPNIMTQLLPVRGQVALCGADRHLPYRSACRMRATT
jgi:osmoprotectant transport system permease protein